MSVSFKVENVEISAVRDRAMFNTFAGNRSYVIKGIGDELAVETSSSSFVATLGTGEAVICGGSMLSEGEESTVTLGQNQSGYLVIEIDLSQTGTNICQFKNVETLVQGDINGGNDYIYDLPLYQYTTNGSGVSSLKDIRTLIDSASGILSINGLQPSENGDINVYDGALNQKTDVDLDTILTPGVYYVNQVSVQPADLHYPSNNGGGNGLLIVYQSALTVIRQFYFRVGTIDTNDDNWFTRQLLTSTTPHTVGTWQRVGQGVGVYHNNNLREAFLRLSGELNPYITWNLNNGDQYAFTMGKDRLRLENYVNGVGWKDIWRVNNPCYKPGDSFSNFVKAAVITASATVFRFVIPLSRPVSTNVSSASVTIASCTLYQSEAITLTNKISSITASLLNNGIEVQVTVNASGLFTRNVASVIDANCSVSFS